MIPQDLHEAIRDRDIDTVEAYYLYCTFYLGGQATDEYAWLSFIVCSGYKPAPGLTIESASETVKEKYNQICYREQPEDGGELWQTFLTLRCDNVLDQSIQPIHSLCSCTCYCEII